MSALVEQCRQAKDRGQTPDQLLQELHQQGLTVTEAIKVYMQIYGVSLGDAKTAVTATPYWQDVVKAADASHDELVNDLSVNGKSQ